MITFIENYQTELIISGVLLVSLLIIRFITHFTVTKLARKNGMNDARIRLIRRYITVTLFLIAVLIEASVFGTAFRDLAVIFSSLGHFSYICAHKMAIWLLIQIT